MKVYFVIVAVIMVLVVNIPHAMAWSCIPHYDSYYSLYRDYDLIFIGSYNDDSGSYHIEDVFKGSIKAGDEIPMTCQWAGGFKPHCTDSSELAFANIEKDGTIEKKFMCWLARELMNTDFMDYARNIKLAEMTGVPFLTLWLLDQRNTYSVLGIIFGAIPLMMLIFHFVLKTKKRKSKAAP